MKDVHLADIGNQDLVTSLAVCAGKQKKLLSELADNLVQLYAWLSGSPSGNYEAVPVRAADKHSCEIKALCKQYDVNTGT